MLRVWVAAHDLHVAADAGCRGVPRFVLVGSAVNLLQLRIVDVSAKLVLDSLPVEIIKTHYRLGRLLGLDRMQTRQILFFAWVECRRECR